MGPRLAWLIALVGLCGLAGLVALATRQGLLPMALGLALVGILALVSLRWPPLTLGLFVVLVPIEEVVVIDGFGTISRLAGILFAVTYVVSRLGRLELRVMPPAAWAFLAWAVMSVGWAIDANAAWAELPTLLQLFAIAVLVADVVVQRPTIVRPVLWVYSLSAAATAMIGIQSFIALGSTTGARAAALQNQNPAQFAAVLIPALVFGFYEVAGREHALPRERLLGGIVAVLTAAGVVVSGTRGAWVAVVVVGLLLILPRLRPGRQVVTIASAVLAGIVILQLPGVANLVVQRADTALATGGAGRTDIWSVATTIYQSAPVLGVGYANFPVAFTQEAVRASDVTVLSWTSLQSRAPHNLVIGTLIELGPIGLLLLALFLIPLVIRRGWGPDAATVQAALASLLTLSLFLDILGNRKQVWLVIGLSAGLALTARRNASKAVSDGHLAPLDENAATIADRNVRARRAVVARLLARHE